MKNLAEFNELIDSLKKLMEEIKVQVIVTKIILANCPF
jgi:hypothetical protein